MDISHHFVRHFDTLGQAVAVSTPSSGNIGDNKNVVVGEYVGVQPELYVNWTGQSREYWEKLVIDTAQKNGTHIGDVVQHMQ